MCERERSSRGRFWQDLPCVSAPQSGGPRVGPSSWTQVPGVSLPPSLAPRRNLRAARPRRGRPRPARGSCAQKGCQRPDSPSDGWRRTAPAAGVPAASAPRSPAPRSRPPRGPARCAWPSGPGCRARGPWGRAAAPRPPRRLAPLPFLGSLSAPQIPRSWAPAPRPHPPAAGRVGPAEGLCYALGRRTRGLDRAGSRGRSDRPPSPTPAAAAAESAEPPFGG